MGKSDQEKDQESIERAAEKSKDAIEREWDKR